MILPLWGAGLLCFIGSPQLVLIVTAVTGTGLVSETCVVVPSGQCAPQAGAERVVGQFEIFHSYLGFSDFICF